jgi:predicted kinase
MDHSEINPLLDRIEQWTQGQLLALRDAFTERKLNGFIRECHGDMHLRNMALLDGEIVIFDCIEFNKNFYLIDVMSEIAFVVMDLEDRQQTALARRFLNAYLQISGDYLGLRVLGFYKVYRAMVRAKVDALRTSQEQAGTPEYAQTLQDLLQYLRLAESYTQPAQAILLINHGLSGSGKSVTTRQLLEELAAIVLRSDVERKRLFNIETNQHATALVDQGLYSPLAGEKTYAHLANLAKSLLLSSYSVIIDAANLKRAQREIFIQLAQALHCPYSILHYQARVDTLRQRVNHRMQSEHDASDATQQVLENQIKTAEPLNDDELLHSISINTEQTIDIPTLLKQINTLTQD